MKSVLVVGMIILVGLALYLGLYAMPRFHKIFTTSVVTSGTMYTSSGSEVDSGLLVENKTGGVETTMTVATPTKSEEKAITPSSPEKSWDNYKKPSDVEIRSMLTDLQYVVTQKEGTERPYNNEYRDNHEAGIYVDIVSGEPLFSSLDKYDSQTGWPSFTKPLVTANVIAKADADGSRTEVRSAHADSHLGHLFDDGPAPLGTRYCMNSASMLFIPAADLENKGYGEFNYLFK